MRIVVVLVCGLLPAIASAHPAHGFSTLIPLTFPPDAIVTTSPPGQYVAAPGFSSRYAHAAPKRNFGGQIVDALHCFFGCAKPPPDPFIPIANDPHSGAAIGVFGPAYMDASPVGHGLAPHEQQTVGY